jgi:hypothetical protein
MGYDKIDMRFAHQIMDDEWKKFEEVQDLMIGMRTRRVSGTLRNEFGDRKYSNKLDSDVQVTSTLVHPDYERFLDMKKDSISRRRDKHRGLFSDNDRIKRKRGRNIHNRVIFGRLNPITFRLMHELKVRVMENVRNRP